jgi:hypothetical protein
LTDAAVSAHRPQIWPSDLGPVAGVPRSHPEPYLAEGASCPSLLGTGEGTDLPIAHPRHT